jgi:hypothetical protein
MIWVTWRQQRTEALIAAGILLLLAVVLVPVGLHVASVYDQLGLSSCSDARNQACNQAIGSFNNRFDRLNGLLGWMTLVPGVIGVVLAAPFILELENGTYRLAWTQSVTPRRFVAIKLGVTVAAALAAGLVLSALLTWWHGPLDHLRGRMAPSAFDLEGTVPIAYVLFALGLALAAGGLWRRTAPAVIVALVGYLAARITVDTWLRERYLSPIATTWGTRTKGGDGGPDLSHAWVLSEGPSDRFGHLLEPSRITLQTCEKAAGTCAAPRVPVRVNLPDYIHTVYQPASRFWQFQAIETAAFGGMALALIAFSAWWVLERNR